MTQMSKPIECAIADTGLWFALCDDHDQYRSEVGPYEDLLELVTILIPWPSMYETLNSRFVKRTHIFRRFERCLTRYTVDFIDDEPYRDAAYKQTLSFARIGRRPLSLVDMIIRFMIEDANLKKHYLMTFNKEDFLDVCLSKRIEML